MRGKGDQQQQIYSVQLEEKVKRVELTKKQNKLTFS